MYLGVEKYVFFKTPGVSSQSRHVCVNRLSTQLNTPQEHRFIGRDPVRYAWQSVIWPLKPRSKGTKMLT